MEDKPQKNIAPRPVMPFHDAIQPMLPPSSTGYMSMSPVSSAFPSSQQEFESQLINRELPDYPTINQQKQQGIVKEIQDFGNAQDQQDEFVADPLPFDYRGESIDGHDIVSMAQNVLDNHYRVQRKLPEPRASLREHYQNMPSYAPLAHHSPMTHLLASHGIPSHPQQGMMFQPMHHMHHSMQGIHSSDMRSASPHMNQHHMEAYQHQMYAAAMRKEQEGIQQQPHLQPAPPSMPYLPTMMERRPRGGLSQEVIVKMTTALRPKYWRNGRRNIQCFPSCKVFGDYSHICLEDLKQHDFMWGKCRGSVVTELQLNGSFSFDDLIVLSRVHSIPFQNDRFEDAVIGECMIGRVIDVATMDLMKTRWIPGERVMDDAAQRLEGSNISLYEFKPKVWKYDDDMVHRKAVRRSSRYYIQAEVFIPIIQGDVRGYLCVGSGMTGSFEVGSSRVLARQKKRAANGEKGIAEEFSVESMQNEEEITAVSRQAPSQVLPASAELSMHLNSAFPSSIPVFQPPPRYSVSGHEDLTTTDERPSKLPRHQYAL